MRSTVVALACTVAGTLGLLALPGTAARADSPATLPQLSSFHQIVVDSASDYVFLSEGTTSLSLNNGADSASAIVVTDLAGNYITTLDAGDGVEGLALSSDGSTLYAALAATDQVAAISADSGSITSTTTTPTQTLYDLGTGNVPYGVAPQTGEIWVSYIANPTTQGAAGFGAIGDVDPTSTTFTAGTASGTSDWTSPPDLAADPSDSNVLVAVQPGAGPAQAATFNTTGGSLTPLAAPGDLGAGTSAVCDFESQIAVVPGGSQFVAGCGTPQAANLYSTADLSPAGSSYAGPSTVSANAVAVSGSGTVAAGFGGANPSVVGTYQSNGTVLETLSLPVGASLADGGLAWSADGTQLFAVTKDNTTGAFSLTVFSSELTLTGSSQAAAGESLTLNGSLTLVSGAALPSGSTVSVTRSGPDGTVSLAAAQPASNGSFTISDTPAAPGTYTYTATYAGDPGVTQPATASFQVTVGINTAKITLSSPAVVTFGANVTVAGKMTLTTGVTPIGTHLTVVRTQTGSTAAKTFSPVSTVAGGGFTVTDSRPAIGKYTYTATYAGSASTPKATAALTVSVERTTPSLTIKTSAANTTYGKSITVTATLGPTLADRWVGIYAGPAGQARVLLKLAKVNAQGNLSVSYTMSRNTTFFAVFSGDVHNAPRTVSRGVGVYVLVYMSTSGYYKTGKIFGTTYQVYHHTALLKTYSRVVPDKAGECIKLEVQQNSNGWLPNTTFGCFTLNKSSVFATNIGLTAAAGAQYRIRTDYIRGSDGKNLSTDGGWVYFEVTN